MEIVDLTSTDGYVAGLGTTYLIFLLIAFIILIVSLWKIFVKAGKKGWISIVPFYNFWVLFEISELDGWLSIIPFVNSICMYIAYYRLSSKFGKSKLFGVATLFFPFVCLPILAFSSAQYENY